MSLRVLVVDDNSDHRFLTRRALAGIPDVSVQLAVDGEDALRRIGDAQPDLVLLDVKMPGMDGFEVLARLRSSGPARGLRVVLFSSSESPADVARARELRADGFVTKPIDARGFAEVARATVEAWAKRDAAP